jgi:large subunit ribosomal protein L19
MSSRVRQAETPYLREGGLEFGVGDSVDVASKIVEGDKERIQVFGGVVIRRRGAGLSETFTVRRIVMGEGVERIFPVHSPRIAWVKVVRRGEVRRSRLYYLRDRVGKATRLRESVTTEEPAPGGAAAASAREREPGSRGGSPPEGGKTKARAPSPTA